MTSPAEPAPDGATAAGARPGLGVLLRLAWPIVVSRSSQVVVGLSDAVMVAHLGAAALAATSAGSMNAFALFILPMGVVFIVSSFSSQLFGMGDLAGARRYGFYGLGVAGLTQVAGVAAIPLAAPLLAQLDLAPEVQALMADYLAIRLWSGGAAIGLEALGNYYGGLGDTRRPMVANVVAMALNVTGNWLLIDGRLGAPAMGVRGAALASALASWLAFAGLAALFLLEGRRLGRVVPRLSWGELGRMLRFGLPSGFQWFIEFWAFNFFATVIVAALGTTSLAALMAVIQVNSVAFMPSFGVASAGAILVGQAIGAGRKDDAPGLTWLSFKVCAAWQLLAGAAYLLLPGLIFAPFAVDPASGPALLEVGRRMLRLSTAWQLFDAGAAVLAESLRAAGDTAFTLWARVAIAWGLFVPGSWISVRVLGGGDLVAVGWIVVYLGALALVLLLRFRGGAWRRLELVEPAPA
jgi:MATE family multidrug resistance protein